MTNEEWIYQVVDSFYQKARHDVLIGYHFRNIKDFDHHIPRIAAFWDLQLLGSTKKTLHAPFDLFNLHNVLGLKRGELGRWMVLFKQSLEHELELHPEFEAMGVLWNERLNFFQVKFSRLFGI